jgi:hypothetical protein
MIVGMEPQRIQAGDQLRCPHCRKWHALIEQPTAGTSTGRDMLFFECRGLAYYGAQAGELSARNRHETRKART